MSGGIVTERGQEATRRAINAVLLNTGGQPSRHRWLRTADQPPPSMYDGSSSQRRRVVVVVAMEEAAEAVGRAADCGSGCCGGGGDGWRRW